jgi:peptidoglycan/xylan/chitin deacetylase (PgdA/CDA1 family)
MIRTLLTAVLLLAAPAQARDIAITFDDLPAHSALPPGVTRLQVASDILDALKRAGVPEAYGFINGAQLAKEPGSEAVLTAWTDAGYPLGNHGWAHLGLSTLTIPAFTGELAKNEPTLEALNGRKDWHWFRFPFLDEASADPAKRAAARVVLIEKGYRIAAVTASFSDWAFNEPYARCMAKGNRAAVAQLELAFLEAAEASIRLSAGSTTPDILLMHLGAFDARMLGQVLDLYRRHGYRFVTLEQAAKDRGNIGLVDPALPPQPGRTLGDAAASALVERVGRLCR